MDEGLPDDLRDRKKDIQYEERFKTVLEGMQCLSPAIIKMQNTKNSKS